MDTGYHDWRERHLDLETTITIETVPGDVSFNLTICREYGYSTLKHRLIGLRDQNTVRDLGFAYHGTDGWEHRSTKQPKQQRKWQHGFSLLSAFHDRSVNVMLTLYKSMVRSKLKYCCPVLNPTHIGEIQRLENVQRSFTRKIQGCKGLTNWEGLKKLNLKSLQRRRET